MLLWTLFVRLLRTAVERASCGVDKPLRTGGVPTLLISIELVAAGVLFGLWGTERSAWDEVFLVPPHTHTHTHTHRLVPYRPQVVSVDVKPKLQPLVCDILPPTTAIIEYAIGIEKLSANEQFFVSARKAVRL